MARELIDLPHFENTGVDLGMKQDEDYVVNIVCFHIKWAIRLNPITIAHWYYQ